MQWLTVIALTNFRGIRRSHLSSTYSSVDDRWWSMNKCGTGKYESIHKKKKHVEIKQTLTDFVEHSSGLPGTILVFDKWIQLAEQAPQPRYNCGCRWPTSQWKGLESGCVQPLLVDGFGGYYCILSSILGIIHVLDMAFKKPSRMERRFVLVRLL